MYELRLEQIPWLHLVWLRCAGKREHRFNTAERGRLGGREGGGEKPQIKSHRKARSVGTISIPRVTAQSRPNAPSIHLAVRVTAGKFCSL